MKFKSFLRFFGGQWLRKGNSGSRRSRNRRAAALRPSPRLRLEALEDRTVMSVLPSPAVTSNLILPAGLNGGVGYSSPAIAIDPVNPQKLIAVSTARAPGSTVPGDTLQANYTIDGGATWQSFVVGAGASNLPGNPNFDPSFPTVPRSPLYFTRNNQPMTNDPDPLFTINSNYNGGMLPYPVAAEPSVAIDRNENVYLVWSERSTDISRNSPNVEGAIVFQKFDFSSGAPIIVQIADQRGVVQGPGGGAGAPVLVNHRILYQYNFADPAVNPVVAVDNNLPTFTDPETGAVQTDPFAGEVYVAWGTNNELSTTNNGWFYSTNPNVVKIMASADGGTTFTNAIPVNDATNPDRTAPANGISIVAGQPSGSPQIVISQGTPTIGNAVPRVQGGQANIIFDKFSNNTIAANRVAVDINPSDNILNDNRGVGAVFTRAYTPLFNNNVPRQPGLFVDEAVEANGTDIPTTTTSTISVNITDPKFIRLTDMDLSINLAYPNLNGIQLTLIDPSGGRHLLLTTHEINDVSKAPPEVEPIGMGNGTHNLGVIPPREYTPGNIPPGFIAISSTINGISTHNGDDESSTFSPFFNRWDVGTVFDDQAHRIINDPLNPDGNGFHLAPEFANLNPTFSGRTNAPFSIGGLNGTWTLEIVSFEDDESDNPDSVQWLDSWSLNMTSGMVVNQSGTTANLAGQTDVAVAAGVVAGAFHGPYPLLTTASPDIGIPSAPAVASDNTLGSFSPFVGRLYAAYVAQNGGTADNTDIRLVASDNGGVSWEALGKIGTFVQVNNDASFLDRFLNLPQDGFSGASTTAPAAISGRAQFEPALGVDPVTGTLLVSFNDGRFDPAGARVARFLATSIDGGQSFGPETALNPTQSATDLATGKTVDLGVISANDSTNNAGRDTLLGYGEHQAILVNNGKVYAAWGGNQNNATDSVQLANVVIASGPRILSGNQGPITTDASVAQLADNSVITYNNTFAPDGTRRPDGFIITFDRPVDPNTFGIDDVTVIFRNPTMPGTAPGISLDVLSVIALDAGFFGPAKALGATRFFVRFDPSKAFSIGGTNTGTYSYTVGPNINDRVRAPVQVLIPENTTTFGPPPDQQNLRIPPDPNNQGLTSGTTTSTISIGGYTAGEVITDLNLTLSITHTFDSDLRIRLMHTLPSGKATTITLVNRIGGSGDNYTNTTFDDQAAQLITAGQPPFTGRFRPINGLSTFNGTNANGTWTLLVDDLALRDIGQLVTWSLAVTTGKLTESVQVGNLMDQNANAITAETPGDIFAVPGPLDPNTSFNGTQFEPPYNQNTLPIIAPGPHVIRETDTFAAGPDQVNLPIPPVGTGGSGDPTQDTTVSTINISGVPLDKIISDLNVNVTLNHTFDQNLVLSLTSPNGVTVLLSQNEGGGGQNYSDTVFDDQALVGINAPANQAAVFGVQAPFTGSFRPEQALAAFNGVNPNGVWTLRVQDTSPGETGTLLKWSLTVQTDNAIVINGTTSSIDVLFDRDINPATFTPADIVSLVGPAGLIGPNKTYPANSGALGIPDGPPLGQQAVPLNSTLAIPDNFNIADLNVALSISDTLDSDLSAVLVAPDGTQVTLFSGIGGAGGQNFTNTVFDDAATTSINSGSAPFNGTFKPTQLLSALNGKNIKGTWTLRVTDSKNNGVTGTLVSWSLIVTPVFTVSVSPNNLDPNHPTLFRITFPTQQLSGTYNLVLSPNIVSTSGEAMDANLNAGVDINRGVSSNNQTAPASFANSTALSIDPQKTSVSSINVTDDFLIQGLTVQINVTNPNNASSLNTHLSAVLVFTPANGGPQTSVPLFTKVGHDGGIQGFSNTIFDDAATTPIQIGDQPFFGRFNPQQPLSIFETSNLRSAGTWSLQISNDSSAATGLLTGWSLTFQKPIPGSGLGEPLADQSTVAFRVFTQDPANPLAHNVWTPVGPAAIDNNGQNGSSGKMSALAIDPSDPSGNTVYAGAASGGVWKTTNFLTTNPEGPTWIPLTDFGPTFGVNIGSIAVFGRNNDPSQSIIFAVTGQGPNSFQGEGNTEQNLTSTAVGPRTSFGVGVLRSLDGGATWTLLDSTTNVDANGAELPLNSTLRDHAFVRTTGYKIVVDPNPAPTSPNDVIVYMAISDVDANGNAVASGPRGGIWKSTDSGKSWGILQAPGNGTTPDVRVANRAGQATDVLLDPTSGTVDAFTNPNGNLQTIYAGLRTDALNGGTSDILVSTNAGDFAQSWSVMSGGVGDPLIQNGDTSPNHSPIPVVNNPNPNGTHGRILLAKPALTGIPVQDLIYSGWLYALVLDTNGDFTSNGAGIYLTKDFGQNWTRVRVPFLPSPSGVQVPPTNDTTQTDVDVTSSLPAAFGPFSSQGNFSISFAIDPTNPNITYIASSLLNPNVSMIRVDTTGLADPHAFYTGNDRSDTGLLRLNTTSPVTLSGAVTAGLPTPTSTPFINLIHDPNNPFLNNSSILVSDTASFSNDGSGATWTVFDESLRPTTFDPNSRRSNDNQQILTMVDPLTHHARLIVANGQGVFTGVDLGDGTVDTGIGTARAPSGSRVGNLQTAELYNGAVQPSNLAAQIAGSLFYGSGFENGFPTSSSNVLTNGDISYTGPRGNGGGIAVDQTGSGRSYRFVWPSSLLFEYQNDLTGYSATDFFQVNGVGRTFGLLQRSNPGNTPDPQWPLTTGFNFAVNPIVANQVIISSQVGRVFGTTNAGVTWSVIGNPGSDIVDGTNAQALAFGAPDPTAPGGIGQLNKFLYAGTIGGHIYMTRTGGSPWTDISGGLDGSPVMSIVTNPSRGSHEAYAVTQRGVYHIADSVAGSAWTKITGPTDAQNNPTPGNIFALARNPFGNPLLQETLSTYQQDGFSTNYLTSIVADWRYTIPDDPNEVLNPKSPPGSSHPMLYVAGYNGVYRSIDNGLTWTMYPTQSDDPNVPAEGGLLPAVNVRDLDLGIGNVNPTTGRTQVAGSPDVLLATTYGRGQFDIRVGPLVLTSSLRLDPKLPAPGGSDSGAQDKITSVLHPFIDGISEQTAFGNTVRIDIINESGQGESTNGLVIGTGTTDQFGRFQIQIDFGPNPHAGLKKLGIRATDDAGVVGSESFFTFTLDTTPFIHNNPPSDTIHLSATLPAPNGSDSGLSPTDKITDINRPVIEGQVDQAAPTNIKIFDRTAGDTTFGQVIGVGTTNAAGAFSVQINAGVWGTNGLNDNPDPKTIGVTADNGVQTSAEVQLTFVLDTKAPSAPSIPNLLPTDDTGASNSDHFTSVNKPHFIGTGEFNAATGGAALVTIFAKNVGTGQEFPAGSALVAANGSYSVQVGTYVGTPPANGLTLLADGGWDIRAQQEDVAGNFSVFSGVMTPRLQINTQAPPPPSVPDLLFSDDSGVSNTDNITNVTLPTFTGTGEVSDTVQILANGQIVGSGVVGSNGQYSVKVGPTPLPDGTYAITAQQFNQSGATSTPSGAMTPSLVIDTTPPKKPTIALDPASDSGIPNDNVTDIQPQDFDVTLEIGTFFAIKDGATTLVAGGPAGSGSFKQTLQLGVNPPNQPHPITIASSDVAGNAAVSTVANISIVAVPTTPTIILDPAFDTGTPGDNITAAIPLVVDGTADAGSNVKIFDGPITGTPIDQFTQSPTSNKFQRTLNLAVGTHTLTVVASDNFGDSATSASVTITVDPNALDPDRKYVRALYSTILGRPGNVGEWSYWAQFLTQPNGRFVITREIEHSTEARFRLVDSWYQTYLGHSAFVNGQFTGQFWVSALQLGQTEEQVLSVILSVPEYFNRTPTIIGSPGTAPSNQTFVVALYTQLLTHAPNSTEVNFWANQVVLTSRQAVALALLKSSEHRQFVIGGYYQSLLKRSGSAADIATWDKTGLDLGMIRIFFESSAEFYFISTGFNPPN
jgi:subtilisin-like proprotein convertase family protein